MILCKSIPMIALATLMLFSGQMDSSPDGRWVCRACTMADGKLAIACSRIDAIVRTPTERPWFWILLAGTAVPVIVVTGVSIALRRRGPERPLRLDQHRDVAG